jgi:hypothetical protein
MAKAKETIEQFCFETNAKSLVAAVRTGVEMVILSFVGGDDNYLEVCKTNGALFIFGALVFVLPSFVD